MDLLQKKLAALKSQGLYRTMRQVDGPQGPHAIVDGRDVLMLCSNNYLGLADHPALKEAAARGVAEYGVSSGASRLVSGNMELHQLLEERIARFKGSESAIVFNSGYAANVGIISAIVGRGDLIFSDRLNHASIVDGSLLSRATLVRYPHNDMAALRKLLERHKTKGLRLIVTDGVFSMDGDMAPLRELAALKREFNALLMVDDAHGSGVLGCGGKGTAELCGVMADVDIHMGTLGKALGSFGAYAAASKDLVDYLVNSARSFIFSTSMPPAVLAASLAALDVVESAEGAELRAALQRKTRLFGARLAEAGLDTMGSETQILPVQVGPADLVMQFSRMLFEEGVFAQGIRPPTVPAGQSRLRCTVIATHADADLIQAADRIATIARKLGIAGAQ